MKPEEMELIPRPMEMMFYDLQNRIIFDIVNRIKKTSEITSTVKYQIEKAQILGGSTEYVASEIKRLTGMTEAELQEAYNTILDKDYAGARAAYDKKGVRYTPLETNDMLRAWSAAVSAQTNKELKNITQSMGFMLNYGTKKVFTPLSEYYQKYLDRACMDVVTGTYGYDAVLRRTVKEMTASGIRTVDYATGRSNRITVAARRAVMTGAHQITGKINEQLARDLETDTYEVMWHSGHRPEHWWGGMVFSYADLVQVCGLGTVAGLCGANCYHSYVPFIPGVSVRTYSDGQLRELEARENEEGVWMGKPYNAYAARQKQRQMENQMRKYREDIIFLKKGNGGKEDVIAAQARYVNALHQYQGFSRKMKLPEQMDRVYMDGLGKVVTGKKAVAKAGESDIIKLESRKRKAVNSEPMKIGKRIGDSTIESGAISGARNPYGDAANEHAKRYYGLVRKMNTDVSRIAKTTGIPEKDIQEIKDYLFIQKHDLGDQEIKRFEPDYMIGESWKRLLDGSPEPHDLTLLSHELMEKELIAKGLTQNEAHIQATAKYNYDKEAHQYYGKIKKYKKE